MTVAMYLLLAIPLLVLASLRLAERKLQEHCWVPTARQRRAWKRERLQFNHNHRINK